MFPKTIEVIVTEKDIIDGKPYDGNFCPLARGLKKIFSDLEVYVYTYQANITNLETREVGIYRFGNDAAGFMWDYDREAPVNPGTFTFRLKEV